ncbi:hypothetical protein [Aliivibrio fischeri]|uniref:hypothetical protein n=1 Tax=Aliivibrio fischeri TaxID=668 RepID=UPI0012D87461|nr:hypothetical protein [Aliivibrio fischeri]MUJ20619.1 hypothetical protein [Aliivibrio fischeri]
MKKSILMLVALMLSACGSNDSASNSQESSITWLPMDEVNMYCRSTDNTNCVTSDVLFHEPLSEATATHKKESRYIAQTLYQVNGDEWVESYTARTTASQSIVRSRKDSLGMSISVTVYKAQNRMLIRTPEHMYLYCEPVNTEYASCSDDFNGYQGDIPMTLFNDMSDSNKWKQDFTFELDKYLPII